MFGDRRLAAACGTHPDAERNSNTSRNAFADRDRRTDSYGDTWTVRRTDPDHNSVAHRKQARS